MRLPWSFGRRGRSAGAEAAGSGAPAIQRAAAPSAPRGAWRELPPIQRAVPDMPLVAEPGAFVGRLPGSQGLPPILEPLGHEVSPLATPGLVVAHPHAVEARSAGALPAPVSRRGRRSEGPTAQRAVAELAEAMPADVPRDAPMMAGPEEPVAAATAEPATAEPATAEPVEALASQAPPVRSLSVISREAVHAPARSLTSASIISPTAQRSPQRAVSPVAPAGASSQRPSRAPAAMPVAGMRRARADSAIGAPLSVSRSVADAASGRDAQPVRDGGSATPGTGEPRRSGLGAPMAELPSDLRRAPTLPTPASAIGSGSRPPRPDVGLQRSVTTTPPLVSAPPSALRGPTSKAPATAPATGLPLPVLPVVDRARPVQRQATPPAVEPAASQPATTVRPTVGRDPIRPRVALQREVMDGPDDDAAPTGLAAPWWAPPTPTADAPGALDHGTSAALSPRGIPAFAGGPTVARSASDPDAPVAPASPRPGATTSATRKAQRAAARPQPPMPIARPAVSPSPLAPVAAEAAQASSAAPAGSIVADGAAPTLQRLPAGGQAPVTPAISATAVVQRVDGAAPDPATSRPAAKPSDRELDELATALFGRIRGRLRNELIHDREAKGLTFDHV